MNLPGGIYRGPEDQLVQGNPHRAEFGNHFGHAEDCEIADVQIGGHGIGKEFLFDRGDGIAKPEAARSMANVENHATLASFVENRVDLAVRQKDWKLLRKNMRVNVAGPGLLK